MNVKFYTITGEKFVSFDSNKHTGIFVHLTSAVKVGGIDYAEGLYFGGKSGWEYLTNTQDAASVATAIQSKINDLDVTNNVSTAVKGVTVKVDEVDGKVSKPVVTIADGAVAENDGNLVTGGVVYTAVSDAVSDANEYTDGLIDALEGTATIASVTDGVVTLKAGVKQVDGAVEQGDGTDITLAKVATTGKAEDITVDPVVAGAEKSDLQTVLGAIVSANSGAIEALDVTGNVSTAVKGVTVKVDEVDGKVSKPVVTIADGAVAENDGNLVTGGVVYNYIDGIRSENNSEDDGVSVSIKTVGGAVDTLTVAVTKGDIEDGNDYLVDGDTVYEYIQGLALGTASKKDVTTSAISIDSTDETLPTAKQVAALVKAQVADLAGAMHFEGVVTGDTLDAAITAKGFTPAAGDIVIYGTKEYVYDGTNWVELGDEGAWDANGAATQALTDAKSYTDQEVKKVTDSYVTSVGGKKGAITLDGDNTANGTINLAISEGGEISASINGLGSAAYTDSTAYDEAGAASNAKSEVIGTDADTKESNTIKGAKAFATDAASTAKSEVIGTADDTKDSDTIKGAKAYADSVAAGASSTLIGTATDDKTADTINGAKAFATDAASTAKSDVIGTAADTKDSDTIKGAKAFATDAVSTAVEGLDATVNNDADETGVEVEVTEVDGKLTDVTAELVWLTELPA